MGDNALQPRLFIRSCRQGILLDVRSPSEYANGHIPGAINFPLFTDEERAEVGTLYKQVGPDEAMERGLTIAGGKMARWAHTAKQEFKDRELYLYCWRGGMRSNSLGWLFSQLGFVCFTMRGGYKAYRQLTLTEMARQRHYCVLGGFTGTGKTEILHILREKGQQVIDLEGLANHKGSAFGAQGVQPTTEQFTNEVCKELNAMDPALPIWIEDESRLIGHVYMPEMLLANMRNAPMVFIQIPQAKRVAFLVKAYGQAPLDDLQQSFQQIRKRLGGQHVKRAIAALEAGNLAEAATIALTYYDKTYIFSLKKHAKQQVSMRSYEEMDWEAIADDLIAHPITTGHG